MRNNILASKSLEIEVLNIDIKELIENYVRSRDIEYTLENTEKDFLDLLEKLENKIEKLNNIKILVSELLDEN